jgi:hypothetical protein
MGSGLAPAIGLRSREKVRNKAASKGLAAGYSTSSVCNRWSRYTQCPTFDGQPFIKLKSGNQATL